MYVDVNVNVQKCESQQEPAPQLFLLYFPSVFMSITLFFALFGTFAVQIEPFLFYI